ncbi:UDP-N-acetylmuramoyl-tripeptide--D-alanyl-D-alanine ligase [Nanchangia anserum]|uniref:UDP-N-acetylmuramoyl-tripeptide--D-alanyl-D- alanine ligase n=1 Tax=Nanchangia anserum TaxID=2692125 RepID=UPI0030B8219D
MLSAGPDTRYLVLEMGASGVGHIAYLTQIAAPDVAVELIIGQAHLGGFGSVEALSEAKAELVDGLVPGGTAVLNADDPRAAAMASRAEHVVTFGRVQDADVRATNVSLDALRPCFTLTWRGASAPVRLQLVGDHHVTNALAAAAAALSVGVDLDTIAAALSEARPLSPHRMAVSELTGGAILIDDSYNANPDSLRAGLDALCEMSRTRCGRSLAVIGEMRELGDESRRLHAECGEYARSLGITHTVSLGGYADDFAAAAGSHSRADSLEDAVAFIREWAHAGDVVLVKGSNASGACRVADAVSEEEPR